MLNRITLMGRLTKDPELRRTTNGTAVVSFTLACERDIKSKDTGEKQTDFIPVTAWGNTAEFAAKYLTKGRLAVASGRIQVRKYTDKDGNNRSVTEVVADNVYFADSKSGNSARTTGDEVQYGQAELIDLGDAGDEELPF